MDDLEREQLNNKIHEIEFQRDYWRNLFWAAVAKNGGELALENDRMWFPPEITLRTDYHSALAKMVFRLEFYNDEDLSESVRELFKDSVAK